MKPRLSTILWWNLSSQCAVMRYKVRNRCHLPQVTALSNHIPWMYPYHRPLSQSSSLSCNPPSPPHPPAPGPQNMGVQLWGAGVLAPGQVSCFGSLQSQGLAVSMWQGIPSEGHSAQPLPCVPSATVPLSDIWATRAELDFSPHLVTEGCVPWAGSVPRLPLSLVCKSCLCGQKHDLENQACVTVA